MGDGASQRATKHHQNFAEREVERGREREKYLYSIYICVECGCGTIYQCALTKMAFSENCGKHFAVFLRFGGFCVA